jgi:hypothetical protein
MALQDLRKNDMMAHLLDALDRGQSIGHYGRLVFAIVARHFVEPDELVELLARAPDCSQDDARSLVQQVLSRGYSPPRREKIMEFQSQQEFAICPYADDPDACNVYKNLQFPEQVYQHIGQYHEQKAGAQGMG